MIRGMVTEIGKLEEHDRFYLLSDKKKTPYTLTGVSMLHQGKRTKAFARKDWEKHPQSFDSSKGVVFLRHSTDK
jgi:hypothetical protein